MIELTLKMDLFKPKLLAEIILPHLTIRKKLLIEGNKIVVRKETKKSVGYKVGFDKNSLLPYKNLLGFTKNKVMFVDGADKCISFNVSDNRAEIDIPVWDRKTEEALMEAEVVKTSGNVSGKLEIPALLYILVVCGIFVSLLTVLVASGRLVL